MTPKKKTKEIAREVNVRYVLEGSVRKAGNNLRITAQLIDGKDDSHLWAEKYSGTLDDIFSIQESSFGYISLMPIIRSTFSFLLIDSTSVYILPAEQGVI